ncbi:MAG: FtsX-like permease family protein [Actinomycetota bacterium]
MSPLWSKAPLVLLRYPRLLVAVGFGTLLLVLAAAAFPLFISAETSRLLADKVAEPGLTRYGAGVQYRLHDEQVEGVVGPGRAPSPEEIEARFTARMWHPLLGPTVTNVLGPRATAFSESGAPEGSEVTLFAGTGATREVRVAEPGNGSGVWIAIATARRLHVHVGDSLDLTYQGLRVSIPVSGVYRALAPTGYWVSWYASTHGLCDLCRPPPPLALLGVRQIAGVFERLGVRAATYSWQAPIRADATFTLDDARSLAAFEERFVGGTGRPNSFFQCCRGFLVGSHERDGEVFVGMPRAVTEVRQAAAGLEGSGKVLQAAGVLVALTVVGAAGAFNVSARKVEAQLLYARGAPLWTVAARTCLEAAVPGILSAALGVGAAFLLARAGPGGPIASSASARAVFGAAEATIASIAFLGLVSAVAYVRSSESHRGRFAVLALVPWELAIVALAALTLQRLRHGGAFIDDATLDVRRPSSALLLFPVLSIGGLGVVGARLFVVAVRWLRGRSGRLASSLYLAVHRLAGGSSLTLLLVAASALCLGVFVHTQTVVESLQTTVDAKAGVFVGSDVAGTVGYQTPLPDRFPFPITRVTRVEQRSELSPGALQVDVLAVDARTVASAAYWNPRLSDLSLSEIARRLQEPGGRSVPAALARGPDDIETSTLVVGGVEVPIHVVARASGFPGMTSARPLVVVDARRFTASLGPQDNPLILGGTGNEFWVKGDTDRVVRALQGLRFAPFTVLTADEVKDIPRIAMVIRAFRILNVLGLLAAMLAILGMLMYLQARQRSQLVSYGLSRRMGMTEAQHRRSLAAELAAMLCVSYLFGLALALGGAALIVHLLDPLETIPPGPLFVTPTAVAAITFGALLVVAWVAGWLTDRRARAVDFGEVMRVAK